MPGLLWIVSLHVLGKVERIRTQILLVDDSVVADHERLNSRDPVIGRNRNQCEPADHDSVDHIVELTQRRCRTLPLQNFKEIAMVRLRAAGVAFLDGPRNALADGTARSTIFVFPVETIALSRGADDPLRVLIDSSLGVNF